MNLTNRAREKFGPGPLGTFKKNWPIGDNITYTVTAANNIKATVSWENVVIADTIPLGLNFIDGSVHVNGALASYTFSNRILSIS